jgi:hypothetical protein
MVTLSEDERERQSPGYSTLTLESVTVREGIETGSADFSGTWFVGDFAPEAAVNGPGVRSDPFDSEVFAIGIHSRDTGDEGVGSGEVGDASSLIGLKILQVGEHTNVKIPIYPVYTLTDVRVIDGLSQSFPPSGGEMENPSVQAAVYTELFFSSLPEPLTTSSVVDVTNRLDQSEERNPLIVVDRELIEADS